MAYAGTVQGSADSDNYKFNLGDGELVISEIGGNQEAEDILRFGDGIQPWDIEVRRVGRDLHLVHINGTDQVVVRNWFTSSGTSATFSDSTLEQIVFAGPEQFVWSKSSLEQMIMVGQGSEGGDKLYGWAGNDQMRGEAGNDVLDAGAGSNYLVGGDGDDLLKVSATATNNTFDGGAGNDTFIGSHNSDTYMFGVGGGIDVIKESGNNSGAEDVLLMNPGINPGDIELHRVGRNLEITYRYGPDKVVVNNWFTTTGSTATFSADSTLERIIFLVWANGPRTEWTLADIAQMSMVSQGGEGDDKLLGWSGNDHMRGEAGNDVLDAGAGSNYLVGGDGDDLLKVSATATDNTFDGGAGNDTFIGSHNSDTYMFGVGGGIDVIKESGNNSGAEDVLLMNPGINPGDIELHRVGRNLEITYRYGPDKVVVNNWFTTTGSTATFSADSTLERIIFPGMGEWPPRTEWTLADIAQMSMVSQGGEGDDKLLGWSGNDHMRGEAGNDVLDAGAGSNYLVGGDGDDLLKVSATATDNTFDGGAGNDTFIGSHNSDTYMFGVGGGIDVIKESGNNSGAEDVLLMNPGINPGDIELHRVGRNLEITYRYGPDKVVVNNWFTTTGSTATFSADSTLERIIFLVWANGPRTEWTLADIAQMSMVSQGGEGDDKLLGWSGNDHMRGEAGNDVLDAGAGSNYLVGGDGDDLLKVSATATDNTFDGGAGNDTLIGSHNSDMYMFGVGGGIDMIKELGRNDGATDYLQFGAGFDEGNLWLERSANDLVLRSLDASDQVRVAGWYSRDSAKLEVILLADGKQLLESQIQSLVDAMASFGVAPGETVNLSADQQQQLNLVLAANWA